MAVLHRFDKIVGGGGTSGEARAMILERTDLILVELWLMEEQSIFHRNDTPQGGCVRVCDTKRGWEVLPPKSAQRE